MGIYIVYMYMYNVTQRLILTDYFGIYMQNYGDKIKNGTNSATKI